jgi:hypothetical protein
MKKEDKKFVELIKCECGYNNQPENVAKWGDCRGCGKVLDKKAKYRFEMYQRLRLWRKRG